MSSNKFKVTIDQRLCKACGICIEFCPKKVLELDKNGKAIVKKEEECIGCKNCEIRCPDFAITVEGEKV